MKHSTIIMALALALSFICIDADAQSYRRNNRNSGFLIDKSSVGSYNPNVGRSNNTNYGNSRVNSRVNNNPYRMNIENSSAGHYDGPVGGTVEPVTTDDNSSTSTSSEKRSRVCSVCKGKGNYVHSQYMGAATAGKKTWCSECNESVHYGHMHRRCETCRGTGVITD